MPDRRCQAVAGIYPSNMAQPASAKVAFFAAVIGQSLL